jgi:hypothetical protein
MVPDVSKWDPFQMLCLHCARKIVSPKSIDKYGALTRYLKFRAAFTDVVKLSFAEIDGIIGDNLPMSAYRSEEWWGNSLQRGHSKAWLDAGWKTKEVNLKEGYVIFQKTEEIQKRSSRKTIRDKTKEPFTPVPVQPPKTKKPSKTKAAKLYARLKNLERQRTSMPKYRGNFKPKPSQEKKLYKPNKKPQ